MKDGIKVFIKNDALSKFLFILRDDKPNIVEPDMWGLAGGGIDDNEVFPEKVKEKVNKELGIDVFDIKQILQMPVTHTIGGKQHNVIGYYFLAKTNASLSEIKLNKGQKASFFTLQEINEMENVAFAIKEILSKHSHLLQQTDKN